METIKFYHEFDPYGEFSNYYMSLISIEGKTWPAVEHYYQAQKTFDPLFQERIRLSETPDDAKDLGNSEACQVRPDWDTHKVEAMRRGLFAKFTQHQDLQDLLLSTGDAVLMEDSRVDYFWGIGEKGTGRSMLGKLLMALREALREEKKRKTETAAPFARGRICQHKYRDASLVDAAMGRIPCDLLIENAQIVNVLTGEIYPGEIAVHQGVIVHVSTPGQEEAIAAATVYDAKGRYAIPGLFDSHVHIESTMLTPDHFALAVLPQGTTTAVTDPHEIGNVLGMDGVQYMEEVGRRTPLRQLILTPSCVPAVPGLERAGSVFGRGEVSSLLSGEGVIGVAEVMDFVGVIENNERMRDICQLADARQLPIQGHAPTLSGQALSAYLVAGPMSDHEATTPEEVLEKLRLGMHVDLRGCSLESGERPLTEALKSVRYQDMITLCTDDVPVSDIKRHGHLNHLVERVIALGVEPVDAIRMASLNAAREYGITNLGAIAPGYLADILLLSTMREICPTTVFIDGKPVVEDGRLALKKPDIPRPPLEGINSVRLSKIAPDALRVKAPAGRETVDTLCVTCLGADLATEGTMLPLPVKNGFLDLSGHPDCLFVAVLNRHGDGGMVHGVVRNLGLQDTAVATTNAHDSHNLVVVYKNPEEGALAVNRVIDIHGGWCAVQNGEIAVELSLPVAGLMSPLPLPQLLPLADALGAFLRNAGLDPLMRLNSLTLPVIPALRITDLGLVDVTKQAFVPLFVQ